MVHRRSAGANNNRNDKLYVSIFFITVLTIVTFTSYNIKSYSASLSTEDNQTINLNSIKTKKIQVGDIDELIIYASTCGTNQSVPPSPEVVDIFSNQSGNMMEMLQRFLPLLFPDHWRNSNPNFIQELPKSSEVAPIETLKLQTQAIINWTGTCDRLGSITKPTMVLVGTDDVLTVPANSILMAEKIPGSWLVQIKGGGHAMMMQYPDKFTNIVDTFLHS